MIIVKKDDPEVVENFKVSGHSYDTKGEIEGLKAYVDKEIPANLKKLTECMTICNDSNIIYNKETN